MLASVTRNEGSRTTVTKNPFTAPTAAPIASPTTAPTHHCPLASSATAALSAPSATVEPIDRSMAPIPSTSTAPMAITVMGADCTTMLDRFVQVRKYSPCVTAKNANTKTKPM
ncbi:hypothetical protein GCM10025876_15360 [Demequina litorisediminis]|uniref:Uncharacterized protein n=1 Tax=Demequina litorisediminis TaxID=1849022 RepID=A0ABQ6IF19_9MICO|nr:hypothetical protein GCM10025876_15360 [Demequina litorisediminis]